jgi:hypothetical protein
MNKESVERLRFDRRLRHRAGWVENSDLEDYLASLPDVVEKITTSAEEEDVAKESATPAQATPVTDTVAAPAPTAGDFSTPSSFGGFGGESGGN